MDHMDLVPGIEVQVLGHAFQGIIRDLSIKKEVFHGDELGMLKLPDLSLCSGVYKKLLLWAIVASIFMDDFIVGGNYSGDRKMSAFDIYYYYFIFLLVI